MLTPPAPTDENAKPAFRNAAECAEWVSQLQLTNLHQAHKVLRRELAEFNRFPADGLERLNALESLRETVLSIQADYGKKLLAKKLPLEGDEFAIFLAIIELWQGMLTGYKRCLQDSLGSHTALLSHLALLCQRSLSYLGLQIVEHLRTGYEFDNGLWRQLHELYALAEERHQHLTEVKDSAAGSLPLPSCSATYIHILLACHAHRADLSRQQLQLLDRWLDSWSATLGIVRQHAAGRDETPPLVIDLNSAQGLQLPQLAAPAQGVRYLITAPLSKLLRVKIALLQQGHSAEELELGEGGSGTDCLALLNYLLKCWCEGQDTRIDARRLPAVQNAQVCYGMESCFAHVARRPFRQPPKYSPMDTLSRKQLAVFGRVLSNTEQYDLAAMGFVLEEWQIHDESIRGARLEREEMTGARLSPGQLVAVRPTNANAFIVGTIIWLRVAQNGHLQAGVRYMPGLPVAVAMKGTGINLTVSGLYVAALLLPEVPVLKSPPSLITPRDWFKPDRVVELVQAEKEKTLVKMTQLLERGADFERIGIVGMSSG
jgi:hypothetical protein